MSKVAKAVVAGVGGVVSAVLTAGSDGHVTGTEWAIAILSGVALATGVWATPNAPAEVPPAP